MFIVFKLVVILLLVVRGSEALLPMPPSWNSSEVLFFKSVGSRTAKSCGEHAHFKTLLHTYLKSFHFLHFDCGNTHESRTECPSRCPSCRLNHSYYFAIFAPLYFFFWSVLKQVQTWLLTQGFSLLSFHQHNTIRKPNKVVINRDYLLSPNNQPVSRFPHSPLTRLSIPRPQASLWGRARIPVCVFHASGGDPHTSSHHSHHHYLFPGCSHCPLASCSGRWGFSGYAFCLPSALVPLCCNNSLRFCFGFICVPLKR